MFDLKGRIALVTGAASGIGRAVAISLAQRGCQVALADVNDTGLAETARLLPAGVRVSQHRLDVSDRAAIAAMPEAIVAAHGALDVLVNNAGVALGGDFDQITEDDFDWLFAINFWGVVRMTRAFLPMLRESPEARIVNLSSIYGIVAPPRQTAYAASKFAVRGFSQALAHELENTRIGITVVHPGGIATSIVNSARLPAGTTEDDAAEGRKFANSLLKMPPDVAGEIIVKAIEQRRRRVLVGSDAKVLSLIERIMPVSYWTLIDRLKPRQ